MSLIIGVDADGVLTDLYGFNKHYSEEMFHKRIVNKEGYSAKEMYGLSTWEEIRFGFKYFEKYCKCELPREGSVAILNSLAREGHILHEITARKFVTKSFIGKRYQTIFLDWLKKNNLDIFKTVQFCAEENTCRDKLLACKKLNVDLMIDDRPEVAMCLAENGIKVALIDAPYNQNLAHENIKRCATFKDVQMFVHLLAKNKCESNLNFSIKDKTELESLSNVERKRYYNEYLQYLKDLPFDSTKMEEGKARFKIIYYIVVLFTLRFLFVKIKKKENRVFQDGFIIISNHLDSMDQFTICYGLKNRYICGYAADTIKSTLRGRIINYTHSGIFINRKDDESKRKGKLELNKRLVNGYTTLIFPEGTRKNVYKEHKGIDLLEFKMGAFQSAQITRAPILPVAIKKKSKYSPFSTLVFGESFFIEPDEDLLETKIKAENIIRRLLNGQ